MTAIEIGGDLDSIIQSIVGTGAASASPLADLRPFGVTALRLVAAATLGATLAYRPWRRALGEKAPSAETAQAQTLIAVSGALMVAVIGESVARAFGLVGLGAFIRFRSGIKDPRDAAAMFLLIGLGMACGLGSIGIAILATVFASALLAVFDCFGREKLRRIKVTIAGLEPEVACSALSTIFPAVRVLDLPNRAETSGQVIVEVDAREGTDAASILRTLEERGLAGIRHVALSET